MVKWLNGYITELSKINRTFFFIHIFLPPLLRARQKKSPLRKVCAQLFITLDGLKISRFHYSLL